MSRNRQAEGRDHLSARVRLGLIVVAVPVLAFAVLAGAGSLVRAPSPAVDARSADGSLELRTTTADVDRLDGQPVPEVPRSPGELCPHLRPIPVLDGTAYLPTYPNLPRKVPDACFSTVADAVKQGHDRARAPRGPRVDGLFLIRRVEVGTACARAALTAGHTVVCPTRVPPGGILNTCAGDCTVYGGVTVHLRDFPVPRPCGRCHGEISVSSAPIGSRAANILTHCGRPALEQPGERWVICPSGIDPPAGGTTYLLHRGTVQGIAYAVKVAVDGAAQPGAIVNELAANLRIEAAQR